MEGVGIKSREYFSGIHLHAAAMFCRRTAGVERKFVGDNFSELTFEQRSYAQSSVIMSVAFLEALINELFCDADEEPGGKLRDLPKEKRALLAQMWALGVPRTAAYGVLEKFQIALILLEVPQFKPDRLPYQDVSHLVRVRNELVHYEPETHQYFTDTASNPKAAHRFEQALRGKFNLNPLAQQGNPFFPQRMLSHGCARWGVQTAVAFAKKFHRRIGVPEHYDIHVGNLG